MNIEDFAARLQAEFVSNKLQCMLEGKHVTLAALGDAGWEYTPKGTELLNKFEAPAEEVEAPVKNKGGRPPGSKNKE